MPDHIDVYLEAGTRRTFAGALEWPGWCRMGRDATAARQGLLDYAPRYARVLSLTPLDFQAPSDLSALVIVEHLPGSATTDFGAPDAVPTGDARPLDDAGLLRLQTVLQACWQAFDATVALAGGRTLRTGPRGGGRTVDGIAQHVLEAEAAYLTQLGGKAPGPRAPEPLRQAILDTLTAAARGEIAAYGPRGGKRWLPRYFVRRAAWHVLDHVWEIEDRLEND